jgi:hypothetical protein
MDSSISPKHICIQSHYNFDVCLRRKFLLLLVITCCCSVGYSQVVRGTVFDKSNAEVIPFASIYISGTTLGTTSNENGYFELNLPPNLSNPLTISSVGFYSVTLTNFLTNEKISVNLEPKTYNLLDINVSGDERRNIRKRYFPIFRMEFLGKNLIPKRCRILNEGDILLQYDRNEKILKAFAKRPIQIQNERLGYHISYFLDRFECNMEKHSLIFTGNYIFTPVTARDSKQQEEFEKSRGSAYLGSRMHLFRSLWDGSLDASGFIIQDSIGHILPLNKLVIRTKPSISGVPQKFLIKQGPFEVSYKGDLRKTMMYLQNDLVPFDSNGYFDPMGIVWDGYMGYKRISDLLPFEYIPDANSLKKEKESR